MWACQAKKVGFAEKIYLIYSDIIHEFAERIYSLGTYPTKIIYIFYPHLSLNNPETGITCLAHHGESPEGDSGLSRERICWMDCPQVPP